MMFRVSAAKAGLSQYIRKNIPQTLRETTGGVSAGRSTELVSSYYSPGISMHLSLRINEPLFLLLR